MVTLVLGAGASWHLGFPVGTELRENILDKAFNVASWNSTGSFGIDAEEATRFASDFKRSSLYSVDRFLKNRQEYLAIGKKMIAMCLIPLERREFIHTPSLDRGPNWYRYLWNRIQHRIDNTFNSFPENLRVLTFNYDRSLEQFLYDAYRHTFGKSSEEGMRFVRSAKILHLHGSLGEFGLLDERGMRVYNDQLSDRAVNASVARMKIVSEESQEIELEAQQMIDTSEKICFLGFGYDPDNMAKLGLNSQKTRNVIRMYGTTYGMQEGEVFEAMYSFDNDLRRNGNLRLNEDWDGIRRIEVGCQQLLIAARVL